MCFNTFYPSRFNNNRLDSRRNDRGNRNDRGRNDNREGRDGRDNGRGGRSRNNKRDDRSKQTKTAEDLDKEMDNYMKSTVSIESIVVHRENHSYIICRFTMKTLI